ncbi:MAG: T9SS type A sorting domain-containing protein [Bacteroidales bacterium]|nr:T9SS type A sorting domain-containing protein [Bacteroidales bacterium]
MHEHTKPVTVMCFRYLLYAIILICIFSQSGRAQQVEVKNNFFYINGQKFFVKGIGYESGALPGELPWEKTFNPEQLHFDITRILSAGYNTIRTWAPFTAQELDVLQNYDIKIIMGIWIDPHADFSDEEFVNSAKAIVTNVLSYSQNYDNIIAYLIMNEPLPETIFNAGYEKAVTLWTELINIIHAQHPDRPVSIANTSNGTYINSDIFDFSAYNVYIYNPVTVNYLHGYRDFIDYLKQITAPGQPLIITEYGLSVSPSGPGNWDYGGNSLNEQSEGILHMYNSIVNGGASGSCVFNYSDGWWKGGNEFAHDDEVEEWFGLVEYTSLTDNQGQERPVWNAVKNYQSAIITQPKSSDIYINSVPVEIFLNDTIDRIDILLENNLVYQKQIENTYLADTLFLGFQDKKDAILVFNCYDKENNLVKSEEKNILITTTEVTLPTIQISTNNDFWQTGSIEVNYQIYKSAEFITDSKLDYIYYPHVGFDYGQKFQIAMPGGEQINLTRLHVINANVNVFTLGAAFEINYNNFRKRIFNQLTYSKADGLIDRVDDMLYPRASIQVYPIPSMDILYLGIDEPGPTSLFDYVIINNYGIVVMHGEKTKWDQAIDIQQLNPGIYFIRISIDSQSTPLTKKVLKF